MKKLTASLLALVMALSLCACGASSKGEMSSSSTYDYAAPAAAAPAMEEAYYDSGDMAFQAGEANGLGGSGDMTKTADGGSQTPELDPDKIIYSAEATLETTEFDQSLAALQALIEQYGGWVESSSINNSNYYNQSHGYSSSRSASYTVRVPSDKFSTLMGGLSDIGNVPYTYTYTENVTSQYYDVQARLTAYKTQETRLLEMMEKAETVSDVITIEDRLTELRYQIESLQSSLNNWDRQVSYSSVYLRVEEVQEYTPEKETKISYGRELWLALTGALKNTGDFFKSLLVFLVSALPAIVILAALFFLLRPVLRKLRDKRRAAKAERPDRKAAKAEKKAAEKDAQE